VTTTTTTTESLDPESLDRRLCLTLTNTALLAVAKGTAARLFLTAVESDKRKQGRVLRELTDAGWLTMVKDETGGLGCQLTPAAFHALAVKPTEPLSQRVSVNYERIADPCVWLLPGGYLSSGDVSRTRHMLWRVLHPEGYRWALVPVERSNRGGHGFPIPLDASQPLAPQVAAIRAAWRGHGDLDLVVSDDSVVLYHQQSRARAFWREHRGRTMLALRLFGGYAKAEAKADEDVDQIPSLPGGPFISPRTTDGYDPTISWEDAAQAQIAEAEAAIQQAQARHTALLARHTKVSVANPGPRPYDAMRARYEAWLAQEILAETGVDPRTLPEGNDW
jgi:hypothetical protein